MNRKAFVETSSSVSFCSSVARLRPGDRQPDQRPCRSAGCAPSRPPAGASRTSACDISAPADEPQIRKRSVAGLGDGEVADQLAELGSASASARCGPSCGMRLVISRERNASAPGPVNSYLAKLAISVTPTPFAHGAHLAPSHAGNRWSGGRRRCPSARRPWARTTAASPAPSCRPSRRPARSSCRRAASSAAAAPPAAPRWGSGCEKRRE